MTTMAYNATITFGVPTGTDLGNIPLEPETGPDPLPATIEGSITSQNSGGPVGTHVSLSALQMADREGTSVLVTIPLFEGSRYNISTGADGCPAGTACADYELVVPASNPLVGTFDGSGTTYSGPAAGGIAYRINARAFNGVEPNCSDPSLFTDALEVTPGDTVTAETLAFTGCTEVISE